MSKILTTGVLIFGESSEIHVDIVNLGDDNQEVTVSILNWTATCPGTELAKTATICGVAIPGGPFTTPLEVELGSNQRLEVIAAAFNPTVTHYEVRVELEKDEDIIVNSYPLVHNGNSPHPNIPYILHHEFVRIDDDDDSDDDD